LIIIVKDVDLSQNMWMEDNKRYALLFTVDDHICILKGSGKFIKESIEKNPERYKGGWHFDG
jgi:hypothetical protein